MNYHAHYNRLIARARGRSLKGYSERHHVLPKCMGGDNSPDNLVDLTAEEHYVAHQLLVKMYARNAKLICAAVMMAKKTRGHRAYGWLRRRYIDSTRGVPKTEEHKRKISLALKGKPKSPDQQERCRALFRDPEVRRKGALAQIGKEFSKEHREKISNRNLGNKKSLGFKHDFKFKEKCRQRMLGNTNTLGKTLGPMSPEHRAKISVGRRAYLAIKET